MSDASPKPIGPDLTHGIAESELDDGAMLGGHADGKPVLLVREGDDVYAVAGECTHYGAPLAKGIVVGHMVRCPWHHACFDVRTGEAGCAPALNPLARWAIERRDGRIRVVHEIEAADGATPIRVRPETPDEPESIVIVGAGAAGNAAAEMLRREGYRGGITMIGADPSVPYDRPNLSKDYLAGTAEEAWIPLRDAAFYAQHAITLRLGTRVARIDVATHDVVLEDGERIAYDRLLLATGADPVHLPTPGADLPHVRYLRTLADSHAIIERAQHARRAVVIGASFIGLEVAASLRERDIAVHVVAPEAQPLARILGPELGAHVRALHEQKGVVFHLEQTPTRIDAEHVTLQNGDVLDADLVVIGVGVRPAIGLAESAGLGVDRGVSVDEYLETSVPNVYAAGDIARWPDAHTGDRIRVEHWVVAERQGQVAARNMLGTRERYDVPPFFWSKHYDTSIRYVGHAEQWDAITVHGDLASSDVAIAYRRGDKVLAVATVGRDRASLAIEEAMHRGDDAAIASKLGQ